MTFAISLRLKSRPLSETRAQQFATSFVLARAKLCAKFSSFFLSFVLVRAFHTRCPRATGVLWATEPQAVRTDPAKYANIYVCPISVRLSTLTTENMEVTYLILIKYTYCFSLKWSLLLSKVFATGYSIVRHAQLKLSQLLFPHIDILGEALENCHKICDKLGQFEVET